MDLNKSPGIAETLDWCSALTTIGVETLIGHLDVVMNSRSSFLKTREDMSEVDRPVVDEMLRKIA